MSEDRRVSITSNRSRTIQFDPRAKSPQNHRHGSPYHDDHRPLRSRRSSMSMRFNSIRNAGGVNSINNFVGSWQRAASFFEINPAPAAFVIPDDLDETTAYGVAPEAPHQEHLADQRTLLRQALERERPHDSDDAIDDGDASIYNSVQRATPSRAAHSSVQGSVVYHVPPQLSSVLSGSYGTTYSSTRAHADPGARRRLSSYFVQHRSSHASVDIAPAKESQPLLIKQVEQTDGHVVNVVVGQSTLYQTIFNSVNVLIGVGLLAIPLGLQETGWVIGLTFLGLAVVCTSYTAKLLAKCLDVDNSLTTFADLALVSFGRPARLATSLLFSLELLATCVALVVLFADSLDALVPGPGILHWKLLCGVILLPLSFTPLRYLSYTSMLGIVSSCGIVFAVFVAGLIKSTAPGSLIEPAATSLWPEHWATVPISLGVLMSPWGGHSVFPNIYRDMRHPYKYEKAVNVTYTVTASLDTFLGVIGVLMFGSTVQDAITSNILTMPVANGYPQWLSVLICICVAIIPITKIPLNASPIVSTVEGLFGLDAPTRVTLHDASGSEKPARRLGTDVSKAVVRVTITASFVVFAILVPEFHRIMSLLGAVACFSICIILPVAFHLRIFGKELSWTERMVNWIILVVSTVLAVVSTVCNFLPKEMLRGI